MGHNCVKKKIEGKSTVCVFMIMKNAVIFMNEESGRM